jgi:glycosyltransferase involved in cell wall biosynthesis
MKIVEIAPPEEAVPPEKYGGIELVVSNVTEGLVRAGHDVTLIASGDSTTSAKLASVFDTTFRAMFPLEKENQADILAKRTYYRYIYAMNMVSIINKSSPDIVHNHFGWRTVLFSKHFNCPMITTVHSPLTAYNERQTYADFPEGNYVSISNNQRKAMPDLNWVGTVYNGIDVNRFDLGTGSGDYFVFLGRTSPEKGLSEICQMIRKTNHKLKIAAKIDGSDKVYFETNVKPYIDGEQIELIGEVDHVGKNKLLGAAKGLLIWLNWEEPFGLVVPEANACGTPVIVNKRGSMPELIEDGVNGFLVDSLDEMQDKLDSVETLSREACRDYVQKNFSVEKMVEGYLDIAKKILK